MSIPSTVHQTVSKNGQAQPSVGITRVAWVPVREMDLAEWTAAGRRLGAMARCGQWWLGDWIRYGNAKFGERYTRVARITGYDVQTLMNMVYVASKFEIPRRRENLSWSHHEALASLDSVQQDYWLDHASHERLSVADLRSELRGLRQRAKQPTLAEGMSKNVKEVLVCPYCGKEVELSRASIVNDSDRAHRRDANGSNAAGSTED